MLLDIDSLIEIFYNDREEVDVFFIDYGTTELLELENIISNIPEYLIELEPQAHRCYLAGVKPVSF